MGEQLPCVCTICNCGRHKCPHKLRAPGRWDKCTLSEYNRQFIPHDVCRSESLKPVYKPFLGEGPLSNETTNRADFIPRCVEAPKKHKPAEYIKPEGKLDDLTMYRKEFVPKESCPTIAVKPPPNRSVPAKFDGQTTNRTDFRPFDLPAKIIHRPDEYHPNKDKFDGIGSYQRDFIPHCIEPVKSYKPKTSFLQSEEPMSKETDYRQSYIKYPTERKIQKQAPTYSQSRVPLDTLTTHQKEFTAKEICPRQSFKPPPHFIQNEKPLSSETTHRSAFRPHDVEKPFKHVVEPYVKPDIDMDLNTTYNKAFIDKPSCRTYSVKPPVSHTIPAPFNGSTSYKDSFQKWDVPPARAIKRDIYEPSTDPFQDCTTSKSAFVPHELCPVKNFKPEPHMLSKEPFDDATMYRTEYTKKSMPCCPAAYLNINSRSISPDGYIYHSEDQRGHQHYRHGSVPTDTVVPREQNANNSIDLVHNKTKAPVILPPLKA